MFDPRIYRSAFIPVALALVALAFSLTDQQGGVGTTLAPDAFNPQNAYSTLIGLSAAYPNRRPGSAGDDALASRVSQVFTRHGFAVSTSANPARTTDGTRTLEMVTATRTGFSSGQIVVVAARDALTAPATADLSGTATLLELARVLSGRTLNRTIVLASISGSAGGAGMRQLEASLSGPVDAVIVLGDMAGVGTRPPIVVPWSDSSAIASTMLRNTVAGALGTEAGLPPGSTGLLGQIARLAFPMTLSGQGVFNAAGDPSVLLSASGERPPPPDSRVSQTQLNSFGRTALQTISALDSGANVPAPSAYLLYDRKEIPAWPVRLLILTLLLPVLAVAVDSLARARRRGHSVGRWTIWVLACALPFLLGSLFLLGLRVTGLMKVAPPGPVAAGVIPLQGAGIAILVSLVCVLLLASLILRLRLGRWLGVRGDPSEGGGSVALLLVMCSVTLAIWAQNPFAAAFLILALHLWMWAVAPDVRSATPVKLGLVLVGLVPLAVAAVYYAISFGAGPLAAIWMAVLLVAGGQIGPLGILEWSIVLGCAAGTAMIALRAAGRDRLEDAAVTVRGPVTYAGPGSLGGTKSALRR
jgi:hypothetical protein